MFTTYEKINRKIYRHSRHKLTIMEVLARTTDIIAKSDDQHMVYGVVLEPDVEDLQGDVIPAGAIKKAAHEFLIKARKITMGHKGPVAAEIVESYIVPHDTDLQGHAVRAGSWLIGVRVPEGPIWTGIQAEEIQAFSIGGVGNRQPID
jgi:hypothetical protein